MCSERKREVQIKTKAVSYKRVYQRTNEQTHPPSQTEFEVAKAKANL